MEHFFTAIQDAKGGITRETSKDGLRAIFCSRAIGITVIMKHDPARNVDRIVILQNDGAAQNDRKKVVGVVEAPVLPDCASGKSCGGGS